MRFKKDGLTIISSMNKAEATAFILFLLSERKRHQDDIEFIDKRIEKTAKRFGLTVTPIEEFE